MGGKGSVSDGSVLTIIVLAERNSTAKYSNQEKERRSMLALTR